MTSNELIELLMAAGWEVRGGKKKNGGSHLTLVKSGIPRIITLPHPRREVSIGLVRQVVRISGIVIN